MCSCQIFNIKLCVAAEPSCGVTGETTEERGEESPPLYPATLIPLKWDFSLTQRRQQQFLLFTNGFVGSKCSHHQRAVTYNKWSFCFPVVRRAPHISHRVSVLTRDMKTLHKHRRCVSTGDFTCSLCRSRPAALINFGLFCSISLVFTLARGG